MSAALSKAGRQYEAGIVTQGGSKLTVLPAPFLKNWKVVQVDYRQGARPVLFHVAVQGPYAYLLTGLPSEFSLCRQGPRAPAPRPHDHRCR